jgi:tRNA (adenine57-N1/adenine58-N1)-methyltransferase
VKKLLIDKKGKRQLVEEGKDLHTHGGVLSEKDLKKVKYSGQVETHKGKKFFILKPSIIDFIEKMEKRAQIVYPKDSAMVIGLTGLTNGSRVVEAGTGVAGLTLMLANAVQPDGKIYTYEIRKEHQAEALKHLEEAGLRKNVESKIKDIYGGIDEKDVDAVILDLPEPWKVSDHAARALKFGGYLVSYSPSIEQVKRFVTQLPKQFQDTNTIEVLVRDWEISGQRCRPKTRMIGHTGFITITRKLQE